MPDRNPDRPLLLVVDDEPGMLRMVSRVAEAEGFEVAACSHGREAIQTAALRHPDIALVDLRMPDVGGLEVIRALREVDPHTRVALMTGHASVDSAVEAIKLGAVDYLTKPFDIARLKETLARARDELTTHRRLADAELALAREFEFCGMIGRSPAMQQVFDLIRRLAPHIRTALITGETGTGKELAARAMHEAGPRAAKRCVTVNCSAVVESLFESELFGHMRGAFTGAIENKVGLFEAADGGTLFLDEIGELPLTLQAKLLRVLESGEVLRVGGVQPRRVDVRVIAATNRDLSAEVKAGRFRSDLYYRLNIAQIHLPPLRERVSDISLLAASFLEALSRQFKRPPVALTPGSAAALEAYDWPGNIRELRNVLERALLLAEGRTIVEQEIRRSMEGAGAGAPPIGGPLPVPSDPVALDDVARRHIAKVIDDAHGNKSEAARRLGISRRALYRRLGRRED